MSFRHLLAQLFLLFALLGCRTNERTTPLQPEGQSIQRSPVGTHWEVHGPGGALLGHVASFSLSDGEPHFSVRDPWQQDLGLIDARGRAYRYRPHQEEPEWVGTGTILQGVERILGVKGATLLAIASSPVTEAEPDSEGEPR